jgi:hypothetical protein
MNEAIYNRLNKKLEHSIHYSRTPDSRTYYIWKKIESNSYINGKLK